ncbi:LINE-1 reverse transcriptase isogeny [Artemisia annua]|uniref:LINE-1 reverse transcriptase isogeny n=1 Tax=Artemisia annua TaxID=35608 RepID=A0A2U1LD46_ARTAN|nr:LINE-1 reverse transcriptase isogeny [Artemisia annua]
MRQIPCGEIWVGTCLTSAYISVLINGSPSKEFNMQKAYVKGPSFFPFISPRVEELLISILKACNKCFYKGISLANSGANISLLQYADYALFFDRFEKNESHIVQRAETRETTEAGLVRRLLRNRGRIDTANSLTVGFLRNLKRRLKTHRSTISPEGSFIGASRKEI